MKAVIAIDSLKGSLSSMEAGYVAVTETASDLVRLGRRPPDHDTERQNPHPDDLSAGELHATHQS